MTVRGVSVLCRQRRNRLFPSRHARGRLVAGHRRFEHALHLPVAGHLGGASVHPASEAGEIGGAQRGGFGDPGTHHRNAQQVGLELHQQVVGAGAAIDPQLGDRREASRFIATSRAALWKAMDSSDARAMCARLAPRVSPNMAPLTLARQ